MMATDDDDDFIIYGTPLEREEDLAPSKRRQAQAQGTLRTLSPWNQEVFDENGRQRFHGAFTGGFSAGFYNTVGSKEGWAPQSFTSSRKKRAELLQKTAYDFMDEDEKAEHDDTKLGAVSEFDTFGFTAAEYARQEAAREVQKRPSVIPGLPPSEIIVPVSDSIGFKLLLKMGWRHGRAIGPSGIAASSEIRKQGRKAMLALAQGCESESFKEEIHDLEASSQLEHINDREVEIIEDAEIVPRSTPLYVMHPKKDRHGFGFDPYKDAPEFVERKHPVPGDDLDNKTRSWTRRHDIVFKPSLFRPNVGRMGSGFGIGAMEELDEEDEDIYAPGAAMESVSSDEDPSSSKVKQEKVISDTMDSVLPGFKPALISKSEAEWFPPPIVPVNFIAVHRFADSLESERTFSRSEPARVGPPEDTESCKLIEGLAKIVARSGSRLENFYIKKKTEDPMFSFLFGGDGHAYYQWRLWEEQRKFANEGKGQLFLQNSTAQKTLDSVQRGEILGETPLDRITPPSIAPEDHARLQSALSSTFIKASDKGYIATPKSEIFIGNPGKQARFELFLKDKFQGGLRAVSEVKGSPLTELERAQENLEFEMACQNLQAAGSSTNVFDGSTGLQLQNIQAAMSNRFASQTSDKEHGESYQKSTMKKYPRREEHLWRPLLLLCKRFNLPDPYLGKSAPVPKQRSRTESFILLSSTATAGAKTKDMPQEQDLLLHRSQMGNVGVSGALDTTASGSNEESTNEAPAQILEKPVDLYKAIFSDDSEEDDTNFHGRTISEDKSAEAAQAALNRLEAGDFLASLGKELGLKVPPQEPRHTQKGKESLVHLAGINRLGQTQDTTLKDEKQPSKFGSVDSGITQVVETGAKHSVKDVDQEAVIPLEYTPAVKDAGLPWKTESLQESSRESARLSILQYKHSDEKNYMKETGSAKSFSEAQHISDGSSSDDDSDSCEKKRQEHKRRKKYRKDSSRRKRKSEKHHKDRKRDKRHQDSSDKHQHHSRRKHGSHDSDKKSSGV